MSDLLARLQSPDLLALAADGGAWPRRLLTAARVPEGWLALVQRADGTRRLTPGGQEPDADAGDGLLLVRVAPVAVAVRSDAAPAACGAPVTADIELLLRWQPRDDDLAALRAALPGPALTRDAFAAALLERGGARQTVRDFIRAAAGTALLEGDQREPLAAVLRHQLAAALFEWGVTLERVTAHFSSSVLAERARLEQEAQQRIRRIETHARVEQVARAASRERLAELAAQLAQLRDTAARGGTRWQELLPTLPPAERGQLLENLWRLTPPEQRTTAIVCLVGAELLWLDPADPARIARRAALPTGLGPGRSVAYDPAAGTLLVGLAGGVCELDAAGGALLRLFAAAQGDLPRTGFNAVAPLRDALFATHSQLGCWRWPRGGGAGLRISPTNAAGLRGAAVVDGLVVYAAGESVVRVGADGVVVEEAALPPQSGAAMALAGADGLLIVGTAHGLLLVRGLTDAQSWTSVYRVAQRPQAREVLDSLGRAGEFRAIESVALRRWGDTLEAVVPAGDEGAAAVYPREGIVGRAFSAPRAIRRVWAAADLAVGLSDARDRLYVARADAAQKDAADVPVARLTGSSIQDVALVAGGAGGQ